MHLFRNPRIIEKTPILTTILLEIANVQQIIRMWTEWTADGQSLSAWICVNVALCLWWNFYRVCTPDQKWAIWATASGIVFNSLVIASVVFFRFVYPSLSL